MRNRQAEYQQALKMPVGMSRPRRFSGGAAAYPVAFTRRPLEKGSRFGRDCSIATAS
jgi:hypothetical protein